MIHITSYEAPPCDRAEILRYAGVRGSAPETEALLQQCLQEADGVLTYRVCWAEFPLRAGEGQLDLGFASTDSLALHRHLEGCDSVVVFAATVGIGLDRLIARCSRVSPAKALLFQAIGAERIESLCETFCRELRCRRREQGGSVTRRFSPGYGDLPLALQKEIFRVLDCPRKIGLTLNESLLMSPSKSVTALVGLSGKDGASPSDLGCDGCQLKSCVYRRTT